MTDYEPTIGLEIHAQLLTESKLFCACSCRVGGEPNERVCPVCLGLPGSLPVLNGGAVRLAVLAALALGCELPARSVFARKNYFYPDLPKGYQISQFDQPLALGGAVDIGEGRTIRITRIHMEEDAGKNVHGVGGDSLVDLNRAGTPLIEIVSEPEIRSSAEAVRYAKAVHEVLLALGVNDGNLEEGSFRCDANVSIRPVGAAQLGTRTELKNLNSFRFLQRAVDGEIARQTAVLDSGGSIVQETRGWDERSGTTKSLRSKEEAHDYRYFPEPDLPPLELTEAFVAEQRAALPELPARKRSRWASEWGIGEDAALTLTGHPRIAELFESTVARGADPARAANWIQTEVLRGTSTHGTEATFPVTAEQVAELLGLLDRGEISGKQAKEVYAAIEGTSESPARVVEQRGMKVVSDDAELRPLCEQLVRDNPKQAEQARAGKKGLIGFFVGQVMKRTGGQADPRAVSRILAELLAGEDDT